MSKTDKTKPLRLRREETPETPDKAFPYTNAEIGVDRRAARFLKRRRAKIERRASDPSGSMSGRTYFRDRNYKYSD